MSTNISGFLKSMLPSIGKSDVETDLEISLEYIPLIIEQYTLLGNVYKEHKFKSKSVKKIVETFYKELSDSKLKTKLVNNFGKDTVSLFSNASVNGEWLRKEIKESLNDVIMSQALTVLNANLLRCVPHFFFISKFATDLLTYIYMSETAELKHEGEEDFYLNKKQVELIEKNFVYYCRILAVYGEEPKEFNKKLASLIKLTIPTEEVEKITEQFSDKKIDIFNNLPAGFVGSPIYSVRLIFAQWEADRYRELKDKKKLLQLRNLHYKMLQENGSSDAKVEKEIAYLQRRITEIDYKLAKIEDSIQ